MIFSFRIEGVIAKGSSIIDVEIFISLFSEYISPTLKWEVISS